MAMNIELFKAILAMDAYNRGYGAGINFGAGSDNQGVRIGDTTVVFGSTTVLKDTSGNPLDIPAGFYAIAYTLSTGETIISYRGTDANIVSPWSDVGSDMWNGYGTGGGNPNNAQAKLAIAFYKAVAGNGVDPRTANILLTGHSLGGGLAGYVGSLYGKSGTLFDNMAFENAANDNPSVSLITHVMAA